MSENNIKKAGKDRRIWILILGGILGVLLLMLGSLGVGNKKEDTEAVSAAPDADAYARQVEEQIREICSEVRGAGEVRVAVTLKGGYRAVYATDLQSTGGGFKNNTVLIGSGSSEGAVLVCYDNPEISGVGIVCSGASDPEVKKRMISLVSAAFDIGTNKIYIAEGQES